MIPLHTILLWSRWRQIPVHRYGKRWIPSHYWSPQPENILGCLLTVFAALHLSLYLLAMVLSIITTLIIWFASYGLTSAQITSNATCLVEYASVRVFVLMTELLLMYYDQLYNSRGQSPCLVASYLGGVCNEGGKSHILLCYKCYIQNDTDFDVSALLRGHFYQGPASTQANNSCMCSSVFYSLIAACAICQNSTVVSWVDQNVPFLRCLSSWWTFVRWSSWTQNCDNSYLTVYVCPRGSNLEIMIEIYAASLKTYPWEHPYRVGPMRMLLHRAIHSSLLLRLR